MTQRSFAIVTTTINTPTLLRDYAADAVRFKRPLERFIVAGDNKTPADAPAFCAQLEQDFGIPCVYLGVQDQKEYLRDFPALGDFLPWNSLARRNVALLMAYRGSADVVITIDDDNLLSQPDYLGGHAHVGETRELEVVSSPTGWWNPCDMLQEAHSVPFYHRGFPLSQRWTGDAGDIRSERITARTVANGGLWLGDPDIDAVTRLCFPIHATAPGPSFRDRVACAVGTWCPFNSQNTAILREAIGGYFLFPFVGRYDDIWASYVVRHIGDHLGDHVTYGAPLVLQKRNEHNLFADFDLERLGLEHNDTFIEAVRAVKLTAGNYRDSFGQIAEHFEMTISHACEARRTDPALFGNVLKGFRIWRDTIALADGYA